MNGVALTEPGDSSATSFAYNQDGAQTRIEYPSGVSVNRGYDLPSGRLTSVANKAPAGSVLKSFAYAYRDTAGRDTELPGMKLLSGPFPIRGGI